MYKFTLLLFLALLFFMPLQASGQIDPELKVQVDDLVRKHHLDGIPYSEAHALGPDAVPYLIQLLNRAEEKEFWVNIIVTLGFIEESAALVPLISFLENVQGEVDGFTFRALVSVPFAVGCIASNGDPYAFNFLKEKVDMAQAQKANWRYKGIPADRYLAEYAVMGMAVSGLPRARAKLIGMQISFDRGIAPGDTLFLQKNVNAGVQIMGRIENEGRAHIFNPRRN